MLYALAVAGAIMDSRERVVRAIEFNGPDRVPLDWDEPLITDISGVGYRQSRQTMTDYGAVIKDEWDCVWKAPLELRTFGEVAGHPLEDWGNLSQYEFPDPHAKARFAGVRSRVEELHAQDNYHPKYVVGWLGNGLWERLHFLRGIPNCMSDLYRDAERLGWLEDRILDFLVALTEEYAALGVDGVALTDDWGSQRELWVHPKLWRSFFKPRYAELFRAARGRGLHVFMHSCGYIYDVIGDLVDAGVNVLMLDQPDLIGVERLGREFGGKVCFRCSPDIQKILPGGDRSAIEGATRQLIWHLGRWDGGLIGGSYGSPSHNPLEWDVMVYQWSLEAFQRHGNYPVEPP